MAIPTRLNWAALVYLLSFLLLEGLRRSNWSAIRLHLMLGIANGPYLGPCFLVYASFLYIVYIFLAYPRDRVYLKVLNLIITPPA